jgi:hypothetical protein
MSRVTLNTPTNSSSADGSRVVLKNGARVPPMRSDGNGCAAEKRLVDLIRCADLLPVDVREGVIGQRFGHAALDQIGGRVHLGGAQIFNDRSCFAVASAPRCCETIMSSTASGCGG